MIGSIYLIGGGEIRNGETQQIDDELKSLAPAGSTFVFFGSAAQDSVGYSDTITSVFGKSFEIIVPTEKKGREYAINAIKSASVIYLGGGDTDLLIRLFSDWGLVDHLIAAHKRGTHIAGMSAGALALCSWYIHDADDLFEIRKGWGLVPICTLVHANQATFNKAKMLWADAGLSVTDASSFAAIAEGAALRIDSSGEQKLGSGDIWRTGQEKQ